VRIFSNGFDFFVIATKALPLENGCQGADDFGFGDGKLERRFRPRQYSVNVLLTGK